MRFLIQEVPHVLADRLVFRAIAKVHYLSPSLAAG